MRIASLALTMALIALEAHAHAGPPPTPEALHGPFEALADYCRHAAEPERCDPTEDGQAYDDWDPRPVGQNDVRGRGAIGHAVVFVDGDACDLAIHVATGWWVRPEIDLCRNSGTARPMFRILELSIRDVVGSRDGDLVLRTRADFLHSIDGWDTTDSLLVCGIGDSGAPSCLPQIIEDARWRPIRVGELGVDGRRREPTHSSLRIHFVRRALVIRRGVGRAPDEMAAMIGRHRIDWP